MILCEKSDTQEEYFQKNISCYGHRIVETRGIIDQLKKFVEVNEVGRDSNRHTCPCKNYSLNTLYELTFPILFYLNHWLILYESIKSLI